LETYIVNILHVLDRDHFKVSIACADELSDWYKTELDSLGVLTHLCPNPYSQVGYVRRMGQLMRKLNTQVVCDFRNDFSAPTLWVAKRLGIEGRIAMYRSSRRGFAPGMLRNGYAHLMHMGTARWASRIVGNTRQVLDAFYPKSAQDARFSVLHNGVDLKKFSPDRSGLQVRRELDIPAERFVIGHVGRFMRAKNHGVILKCFRKFAEQVPSAHLLLVGEGDLRGQIEATVVEYGLSERVTLSGRRKDVPDLLAAMDLFFYPSVYEGLPNALLEAMAAGVPVIASSIPEIVEIFDPHLSGQLYETDDVDGMVRGLVALYDDRELRADLGRRLRRWVSAHFSLAASAEKMTRLWTADLGRGEPV
ncbi:MAG: glycosyltransferase, partial [Phycisphaerae bacterium]